MKTYWGLKSLRDVYCPKCGNYLQVVPNGLFHGELFYCPKEKFVFNIVLKDITKHAGKEYLDQCEFDERIKAIGKKLKEENIESVEKLLNLCPHQPV